MNSEARKTKDAQYAERTFLNDIETTGLFGRAAQLVDSKSFNLMQNRLEIPQLKHNKIHFTCYVFQDSPGMSAKEYTLSLGRNHKLRRKPYSESEDYDTGIFFS